MAVVAGMAASLLSAGSAAAEPATGVVEVGPLLGARRFTFREPSGGNLRDYEVTGAFGIALRAEAYPVALSPHLRLGLSFGYHTTTGLYSDTDRGRSIPSIWTHLEAGVGLRLALGEASVALGLGAQREHFDLADGNTALPAARYLGLRAGLALRLPVGPVALLAAGAALPVIRVGGIAERWAKASAFGFEAAFGVAVPLTPALEARALLGHTRYGSSYEGPSAAVGGDASGATDALTRLQVTLVFSY